MKRSIYIVFALVIFSLAFYLQNRYAILSVDDWIYAFKVDHNAYNYQSVADDDTDRQIIHSFYDAILSQSQDYFKTNGRFIIHTLVQYLCGTKTMQQFIIINSIMFALFTLLIVKVINRKIEFYSLLFILSAIWILLPHKGLTFMGNITCSVNYLWTSVATLLFIYLFEKLINKRKFGLPIFIIFTFYSFVTGSLQESFSIGITGMLIIYLFIYYQTINKQQIIVSIAYILGTCICILSPANFRRFDDIGGMGFHCNSILGLVSSPVFLLFIICMIILAHKNKLLESIYNNFIIIIPIIINVIFSIFIAYNGRHQLTAINVFSMVFIMRMWMDYLPIHIKKTTTYLLTFIALLSYYPILIARKSYYNEYTKIIERTKYSIDGTIIGTEFEEKTAKIKKNHILECNYIATFTFQDWDFYERSLSIYLTQGKDNRFIKEVIK
jgi:hypothetical protein